MTPVWEWVRSRHPERVLAVAQTGLALLVLFGLNLSGEQVGAIMAFLSSVVALLGWRTPDESDGSDDVVEGL